MEPPEDYVSRFDELFGVGYRAAYAVLGDRGDAEDVAQDTLAKALVRWRRVGHHPIPWIARVATNGAIDRWRARERRLVAGSGGELRGVGGRSKSDVAAPIAVVWQRNDLVRALRVLPRRQREAVVMRHLLDFSEKETATALRCSIGTVKSATSRGLSKLREQLDDPSSLDRADVHQPDIESNL